MFKYLFINHIDAPAPKTLVTTFCPNEPTAIANTPCIRLRGGKNITRPPYSPRRLGVNMAHVNPQKTPSMAFHKVIGISFRVRYRHFNDSSSQLTNIKITTSDIISITLISLICCIKTLNCLMSASFFKYW